MRKSFDRMAKWTARQAGRPVTFALAVGMIVLWAASGPILSWSDTWMLLVNTGTTVITFLMVFVIQASQNRDTEALQLKLDELIRVTEPARNQMVELEDLSEDERAEVKAEFAEVADREQPN